MIHIWQGERSDGHLKYMYKPVMNTLILGFQPKKLDIKVGYYNWNDLKKGDIFIWIGIVGLNNIPWIQLRKRGVYCIYFETDAINQNRISKKYVDEIWDYSWKNIDNAEKDKNAPKIRYVPIAYYDLPRVTHTKNAKLIFMGDPQRRKNKWQILKKRMNNNLSSIYNIWSENDYQIMLNLQQASIFLNIHSENHTQLESLRISHLLSSGAIIISERSYWKDEKEYEGLIDFVNLSDIQNKYNEYAKMSLEKRKEIANKRFLSFKQRFGAKRIFENAKINILHK